MLDFWPVLLVSELKEQQKKFISQNISQQVYKMLIINIQNKQLPKACFFNLKIPDIHEIAAISYVRSVVFKPGIKDVINYTFQKW